MTIFGGCMKSAVRRRFCPSDEGRSWFAYAPSCVTIAPMINEPGYDYQPRAQATPPPAATPPPSEADDGPQTRGTPTYSPLYRPFWLRFAAYFLLFIAVNRLCGITTQDPVQIVVQLANVGLLFVVVMGLLAARRWAGQLLVIYCAWAVISALVVGLVRLNWVEEAVSDPADYDLVRLLQVRDMGLAFVFYTALGIWTYLNLKRFTPAGENRYGNVPYVLIIGLLALFTATQISGAFEYVEFQAEQVDQSFEFTQDLFD